jgi:hypothetical protein
MVVMGLKGLSGLKRAAEMAGGDFYFKGQAPIGVRVSWARQGPLLKKSLGVSAITDIVTDRP